jgi:transcriptional regulator with XRE-family HTH domain
VPSPSAPEVRLQFAKRLKQLRTEKGFLRARTFANALGIHENRYTRYERAEVEPNLTLIHKICGTLRVLPNDLFDLTEVSSKSTVESTTPMGSVISTITLGPH